MDHEFVLILDFGGQYNQLIARRVRECSVYCEVKPYNRITLEEIKALSPKGIIFTGGPQSVYGEGAPSVDKGIFELGVPVLGICYGSQLMAYTLGGKVQTCESSEYGKTETEFEEGCELFEIEGLGKKNTVWMSHTDYISDIPRGFKITAHTEHCPVAAMANAEKKLYAVQFHPEVNHTVHGTDMIYNFVRNICGCKGDWTMGNYAQTAIKQMREKIGSGKVLLALSGGVDSSVAASLLS